MKVFSLRGLQVQDLSRWSTLSSLAITYETSKSGAKAPSAPTATSVAAVDDATNHLFADNQAGSYLYAVSAINKYGESQITKLGNGAVVVTDGKSVDLKFAASDSTTAGFCYLS